MTEHCDHCAELADRYRQDARHVSVEMAPWVERLCKAGTMEGIEIAQAMEHWLEILEARDVEEKDAVDAQPERPG